jgi:P-type E1-E2 ATPase
VFGNEKYLYDPKRDFKPASRSLNLHEDLGQIKYIFSDKTGTLTKNKMILQTLAVGHDVSILNNPVNMLANILPSDLLQR